MKAVRKFALFNLGLISAAGAFASTSEQDYLETCDKDPRIPVPITVVSPTVGPEYHGATVRLEFVVGIDGKPAEFSIKSATDDVLATAVVQAVKQWRFQPAEIDGRPVAKKVVLPVRVTNPELTQNRYAAK
jgi:TonB family protein